MTHTIITDPFAAFATLKKSDPAPEWLVRAIAAGWGYDLSRIDVRLITVSENATFRLDLDGVPHAVLRVHRPGHVDPRQISSELTWVRALAADTDISVPEVMPLANGALVLAVDDPSADAPEGQPWHVVAFAFLRGEVLEEAEDPRPHYRRIGEITATFHEHSDRWQRPAGFDRFTWNLDDMLGPTSRWGDWRAAALTEAQFAVIEHAERQALDAVGGLLSSGEGRGLVHADLRPSNIMTTERGLTVIDFDDCGNSWLLYDFASAFSFIDHEAYAPEIAQRWLEGYTSVRSLSDEQLRYACALSTIRRFQLLGWTTTHREDALPPHIWQRQISGSAEIAHKYLANELWLLG